MRRSPVEAVIGAVVTALKASTGVMALATGVYNHVPQETAYPYLVVSSPSDARMDTFGRYGATVLVNVRAVSQAMGDREGARLMDQCIRTLDFQPLATTQHTTVGVNWDAGDRYPEVVNGIQTRHHVGSFRVWTEQSSS